MWAVHAAVLVGVACLACFTHASPGDLLAKADFRNQDWLVSAPRGTGSVKGLEIDTAQNAIKLKDAGKYSWWFESPQNFLKSDMVLAYNGTLEFFMQSLEWENTFLEDYDIVLVSSSKRYTVGLKGVKKDGETSKTYTVRLSETAGKWEHLYPFLKKEGGGLRSEVAKDAFIKALNTLTAIRVRGGYYMGVEKTQLRSLKLTQGMQAQDEKWAGDGECCGDRDRTCTTNDKFDLVFDNKGLNCIEYTPVSWGTLIAGDNAGEATKTVRLSSSASSPKPEFYLNNRMDITGGLCGPSGASAGCSGSVTSYLGELSWTINSGVTNVEIEQAGTNCSKGGLLAAAGQSGSGFEASFDVKYTIPSVLLKSGGAGCSGSVSEGPFTNNIAVNATTGAVTGFTGTSFNGTGSGYITGRAYIECLFPCTGSGLVVRCDTANGDITGMTLVSAGLQYSTANPPTIYCPQGNVGIRESEGPFSIAAVTGGAVTSVTLPSKLGSGYLAGNAIVECSGNCTGNGLIVACVVDALGDITALTVVNGGSGYVVLNSPSIRCQESITDPPNPGSGFVGTYATNAGKIIGVNVQNAGTGYNSNIKVTFTPNSSITTCINVVWDPRPSGYLTKIRILKVGTGFSPLSPPLLSISSGGEGCMDFVLRSTVGDATPAKLLDAGTSGGIMTLRGSSSSNLDGYYDGMSFVMLSGGAVGQVREIKSYTASAKTIVLQTPFTVTPAANDLYAITTTPPITLLSFSAQLYGALEGALSCVCTGGTQVSVEAEVDATEASCQCEVILAATSSDKDDFYNDATLYFPELDLATTVVDYTGANKKAKVAVRGSANTGYNRELLRNTTATDVAIGKRYVLSAKHLAKVTLTNRTNSTGAFSNAHTDSTSTYTMSYQDYSAPMQAHSRGQPFFCEQAVGDQADYIVMPFERTFAFRSTPLICTSAVLSVSALGQLRDDLLWPQNNLTVVGESGEVLGMLFTEPSALLGMQEGGPVTDQITISQEKMLEMTSDGDFIFSLVMRTSKDAIRPGSTSPVYPYGGAIKVRSMKLSFSPAACYHSKVATDEYTVRNDITPGRKEIFYNLSFLLPAASSGTPVSDGVLTLTADADLADGFVELSYPNSTNITVFKDWTWTSLEGVYALSEPSDVGVTCTNNPVVDLQRYTITGVTVTRAGSDCSGANNNGPFTNITVDAAGAVQSVVLPSLNENSIITGKALITSHGSGNGALVVRCTADAAGDITGFTFDNRGAGYSIANPPRIYCPEGTVTATATLGTTNPGTSFAGKFYTSGANNGGAIIGVTVDTVGSGYTKNVRIKAVSTHLATSCKVDALLGIGDAILAYAAPDVAADPTTPARVCRRTAIVPLNGTRSSRHTAHHRIPRSIMAAAAAKGVLPVSFKVVNGMAAKLSPVQLTYSLMHCKLMTLNGKSGIGQLGVPAYRPSNLVLTFGEDVPAAAADATLWVHAHIQNHRLHVRDMIGVPNGAPRGFSGILDTDAGQPYDVELLRARDPLIKDKYAQRYWPHIGAIRVRVGDTGQSIDWMFLKDYSQYSPNGGYVDSIRIPRHVMAQFDISKKAQVTLEIPPGDSTIIIHSAVLAYPAVVSP